MRRRRIALGMGLAPGLAVATPAAQARRPTTGPRIGVLGTVAESPGAPLRAALEQGLRQGCVGGKTILERAVTRERAGAPVVLPDPVCDTRRVRVAELAAKRRLPAMSGIAEHAEAGGLMAPAADLADDWRRAAARVDTFLQSARLADLPVRQPTRMAVVINLGTARALGPAIPPRSSSGRTA